MDGLIRYMGKNIFSKGSKRHGFEFDSRFGWNKTIFGIYHRVSVHTNSNLSCTYNDFKYPQTMQNGIFFM